MQIVNRSVPPEIKPLDRWQLTNPEVYTLRNGIRVVQFDAGTQDLVRIEFIFNAGSWYQDRNFLSLATNLMLREGTNKSSSRQIADKLDFYGAHLETTAEKDNAYVTLYTLNKHLESTLPVLQEIIREAVFPEEEFGIFSGKQSQMLQVNMQKVNFLARTRFNTLLFGKSHPYGNYLELEDISKIKPEDLREYHRLNYQPGNCTIMIAGKIDTALPALLDNLFGSLDWQSLPGECRQFVVEMSGERNHFLPKTGALQSAIRIGKVLINRSHPDFHGMKILTTLLGGFFGSRLMTNLREDKGYTYGIGSAVIPLVHAGYFFISCEVGADVTLKATQQIRAELLRLRDEKAGEKELSLVKNYMLGSFLRGIDGPFAMADTFRDVMEQGLNNEYLYSMLETIREITPAQLQELAGKYLDPDEMHQLVVGSKNVE